MTPLALVLALVDLGPLGLGRAYAASPTASNVKVSTSEDTAVNASFSASDADGDSLTFSVARTPSHGTVTLGAGARFTFTPEADYNGADSFTYRARDSTGAYSGYATVSVSVAAVNDTPVATAQAVTVEYETPTTITLTGTDIDGDALSCTSLTSPSHGTTSVKGCTVSYRPYKSYSGADAFSFRVSDGTATSALATVTLTVRTPNTAPTAADRKIATSEDTAGSVKLGGSDADGDPLTYSLASSPAHGSVAVAGSTAVYTPAADWSGTDSFTYTASDGRGGTSAPATVTVSVSAVNDAPTVSALAAGTTEDTAREVTLAGTDAEGETLTYTITTPPAYGTASVVGDVLTYTPTADWYGSDSLRYVATDPAGATSASAQVSLTVTSVNDAPVADDQSVTMDQYTSASITLSATDVDSSSLTYSITTAPAHGTATLVGKRITYTPDETFYGVDTIGFTVRDGPGLTDDGLVTVTVNHVNAAPESTSVTSTTAEDTAITFALPCTDVDGDALTYATVRSPTNGTVSLAGELATYTPEPDFTGADVFTWRCSDGTETSATASASLTVTEVNDPPVVADVSLTTNEDTNVSVRLASTDVDSSGGRTYDIVSQGTLGSARVSGSTFTYIPREDANGVDTVTYTASDGVDTSVPATITITITSVADAPVAFTTYGQIPSAGEIDLVASWTDADPETTSVTPVLDSEPTMGRVSLTADGFHYEANVGWYGVDRFTWHVVDEGGRASGVVTAAVNVHPVPTLDRPEMPQWGFNKILFDTDETSEDRPQFNPTNVFADLAELGTQFIRQTSGGDLEWAVVELEPGSYSYKDDNPVIEATDVLPSMTLFHNQYASPTPPYCAAGEPFQKYMGAEAFDYLDVVLSHYADTVDSYEIGNEMYHWVAASGEGGGEGVESLPDCYPSDGYSPADQGIFVEEASRYVRAFDPEAQITLASVAPGSSESDAWVRDVLDASGTTDWFDILSYHDYTSWSRMRSTRPELAALFEEVGVSDKLVRLTETGSSSDADFTERTNYPNSDESQAADIFRRSLGGFGMGDASVVWHTYLPVQDGSAEEFQGFEVAEYDGTWKPSAYAVQLFTENLLPFAQITDYTADGAYTYRILTVDAEERWVVWGDGETAVIPAGMTEYTSVYPGDDGTFDWYPVSPGDEIALTDTPLLIR